MIGKAMSLVSRRCHREGVYILEPTKNVSISKYLHGISSGKNSAAFHTLQVYRSLISEVYLRLRLKATWSSHERDR